MERVWWSRLRWRMRGAWMWPTFAVLTVVDGVLLRDLPFTGDGSDLLAGTLLAGFINLFAVAIIAPLLGRLLRRRRSDLPKLVASDYTGTAVIVAISVAIAVGGLVHRPVVVEQEHDFRAQGVAARTFVLRQAPASFHAGLSAADTIKLESDLYRTCVPGDDPKRSFCMFVRTDEEPPGVRKDPNREPNSSFAHPGAFGAR